MAAESAWDLRFFFCYAHEDRALCDKLEKHLSSLKRQKLITIWYDHKILPGIEWEQEIDTYLSAAHIILLLVSPNFIASEYCYSIMKQALDRHERGEVRVIPIILRPVLWHDEPFNKLQALPTNGRPVMQWANRDAAFNNVAEGIQKVVNDFLIERWLKEGKAFREQGNYKEALAALEKAIQLDPNNAQAYYEKGIIFRDGPDRSPEKAWAGNYLEEALAALEKAIQLDPNNAQAYYEKGNSIHRMELYSEILTVLEKTIQLDPGNIQFNYRRETILRRTKHFTAFKEALTAFEKAIQLDPNNAYYYREKGHIQCELGMYKDALETYGHAIQLNPEDSNTYIGQGDVLLGLNRFVEALRAYRKATRLNSASRDAYLKIGLVYGYLAQEAYDIANALENEPE